MRILFRTLLLTVVCVAVLLVYVSTTRHGLQLLWQNLRPLLPTELTIDSLEGRLTGPLSVSGLMFRNDAFKLELNHAELEWTPRRLLSGVLQVDRLVLEDGRYTPGVKAAPVAKPEPVVLPERMALPIGIRLEQFRVTNFTVETASGSPATVIERGDLSLSYQDAALEIRHVSVQSPDFQIAGSGNLGTAADYPLQAAFDWRLSPVDYADIAGQTRVSGNLNRLTINQTFNETYPVTGKLLVTNLPASPVLDATVNVDGLALQAINADLPAIQLTAAFQAGGPVDALSLSGGLELKAETLPMLHAELVAQLAADRVELEQLHLTSPDLQTELRVSGPVDFKADGPEFDLRADWRQARWPLAGAAQLESPTGHLHLQGSPNNYRLNSQIALLVPGYTDADLSLQGSGNLDALQLSELNIATLDGHLQGTASIAWRPQLATSLELKGSALNPGLVLADWPGQLNLQLTGQADFFSNGIVAQLPRLSVNGQLRDLPVRLDTRGGYQQDTLTIEAFKLVSGPSTLQLSGAIGTGLAIDWKLESPDLHTLLPAAAGRRVGDGHMGGP